MKRHKTGAEKEEGQSIVLLAFAMVGLLVFAGLAVDAGVIYVTSVRLSRAVDAAALAGVVELPFEADPNSTDLADARALQFLAANEITTTVDIPLNELLVSSRQSGVYGTYRYWVTATHEADLYFMPLVNFDSVRLRDHAVAEYNPLVNLYTSQTGNYGTEQTSNLAIFGPDICTGFGDPFTPPRRRSGALSAWYGELNGVYPFQIEIPADYESRAQALTARWNSGTDTNNVVRLEIWDPDCYNRPDNSLTITNTLTLLPMTVPCGSTDRKDPCITMLSNPPYNDSQNRFGFVRIDENRGVAPAPGNQTCGEPSNYNASYNTITEYTLYYYRRRGDGTVERRDLARYTKGGAASDSDTDMRWVCPGGSLSSDAVAVPDGWPGSSYGFAWDEGDGNFEITDLDPDSPTSETPDIYVSPDGKRSLFLDVRGVQGASENGFDLWVGPRYPAVPSEVNARNVDIIWQAGDYHGSAGAASFAIGHLPMNSNATEPVTLTLAWVPPEWAGRTMQVQTFDNDSGSTQLRFIFSSIPYDWESIFPFPGGGRDDRWFTNVFTVPSQSEHTFYGGYLQVIYQAGAQDTYGWVVSTEGIPSLVE